MASVSSPPLPIKGDLGLGQASKRTHAYNVASIWEKAAALDEEQLRVIEDLNVSCSQRPIPAHVRTHRSEVQVLCMDRDGAHA